MEPIKLWRSPSDGANDAAVIFGDDTGTVVEDATVSTVVGNLAATDVDNPDDSWIAIATQTESANGFGTFIIDAMGNWTYTLDNTDPMVDGLNGGQTLSDLFTVQTVDGTSKNVNINIQSNSNQQAVITGDMVGELTEDTMPDTVSGDLNSTDADNPNDSWMVVASPTVTPGGLGTYTTDANGGWSFIIDNTNPFFNGLSAGATVVENFTVYTVDGTPQIIAISINGVDDPLRATSDPATDAPTGDMALSHGELVPVIEAAIARWTETGLTSEQITNLEAVTFEIADLQGDRLVGVSQGGHIIIDNDAAGPRLVHRPNSV